MSEPRRLMAVLAHPDDESLGVGGALAEYATRGVACSVVTATHGQRGRYFTNDDRPSDDEVGRVREGELRAAAAELGVRDLVVLDYTDGALDRAAPDAVVRDIVRELRRVRPQVVVTFDPFGAYGHPDHVAICQLTTAAVAAASDAEYDAGDGTADDGAPHAVAKLYYFVADAPKWNAYQAAFKTLISTVDGVARAAMPWPDWSITARVDTSAQWQRVWRAVQCHRTQMAVYKRLGELTPEYHAGLWGSQTFYRAMSRVNGGRTRETDLFVGIP